MKLDASLYGPPAKVAKLAGMADMAGFSGGWVTETGHNPFVTLALAAPQTRRMTLGTGVAIALARSPMTLAQEAWDLQEITGGRFILGLGSQVKAHIVRRFGMRWEKPVEQMREMVLALRAIWDSFQHRTPLKFEGEFYRLSLLTPFFSPEPMEHWRIPIHLAAVGPKMTEMAGEVADGLFLHAFTHRQYLEKVTLPALEAGLAKAGRSRGDVTVVGPIFLITGEGEDRDRMEAEVRKQIAFYGSTPAYAEVLALLGHEELHKDLHRLSREGKWDEMARLIPEDVMEAIAVRAPMEGLAAELQRRYEGVYDRMVTYSAFPRSVHAQVPQFLAELQSR